MELVGNGAFIFEERHLAPPVSLLLPFGNLHLSKAFGCLFASLSSAFETFLEATALALILAAAPFTADLSAEKLPLAP